MNEKPPRRKRYKGTHPRRFEEKYKELDPGAYPDEAEKVRQSGRTPAGTHVPVMLTEVIQGLAPKPGDVALDCTLGYGGHSAALAETGARVIATDLDSAELARTVARLNERGITISAHHTNFAGIGKVLAAEGLSGVDCLLADLGLSSMQLDDPARGFGFKLDAELDMRMDTTRGVTAAEFIAQTDEETLAAILTELGDEPKAAEIAAALKEAPPTRTGELTRLVLTVNGLTKFKKRNARDQHPAARVFQALRMSVNRETENLDQLLRTLPYLLNPGGRAALITFHSGEERRVRDALQTGLEAGLYARVDVEGQRPTGAEVFANPRSRSAKLFVFVRA